MITIKSSVKKCSQIQTPAKLNKRFLTKSFKESKKLILKKLISMILKIHRWIMMTKWTKFTIMTLKTQKAILLS